MLILRFEPSPIYLFLGISYRHAVATLCQSVTVHNCFATYASAWSSLGWRFVYLLTEWWNNTELEKEDLHFMNNSVGAFLLISVIRLANGRWVEFDSNRVDRSHFAKTNELDDSDGYETLINTVVCLSSSATAMNDSCELISANNCKRKASSTDNTSQNRKWVSLRWSWSIFIQ